MFDVKVSTTLAEASISKYAHRIPPAYLSLRRFRAREVAGRDDRGRGIGGGGGARGKANYEIIAFNCDSCYLRNGVAM